MEDVHTMMKLQFIENFAGMNGENVETFQAGKVYDFIDSIKANMFIRCKCAKAVEEPALEAKPKVKKEKNA